MEYVKRVLLPKETVLYWGKVSPAIYLPGAMLCGLAVASARYLPGAADRYALLWQLRQLMRSLSPYLVSNSAYIITGALFFFGVVWVLNSFAIAFSTELAVTNRRVIAKYGITHTVTTEIDRHKIAGVVIRQTILGKIFNYGRITLRGYAGDITNMPPISRPYDFQKYVNARIRL